MSRGPSTSGVRPSSAGTSFRSCNRFHASRALLDPREHSATLRAQSLANRCVTGCSRPGISTATAPAKYRVNRPASSVADMTNNFMFVEGSVFVFNATSRKSVKTSRSWASSTTMCVTRARPSARWSRLNNTPTVTNSSRVRADRRTSNRTL